MTVVTARELDHAVAAGERPREPERGHRRLRPGRDEPHLLDRRHGVAISAASSTSRSVGAPKLVPSSAAARTASTVSRVGVAEDQRAPRLDPVEQPPAVAGLEVGALAAR